MSDNIIVKQIGTGFKSIEEARQAAIENKGNEAITKEKDGTFSIYKIAENADINMLQTKTQLQESLNVLEFVVEDKIIANENRNMERFKPAFQSIANLVQLLQLTPLNLTIEQQKDINTGISTLNLSYSKLVKTNERFNESRIAANAKNEELEDEIEKLEDGSLNDGEKNVVHILHKITRNYGIVLKNSDEGTIALNNSFLSLVNKFTKNHYYMNHPEVLAQRMKQYNEMVNIIEDFNNNGYISDHDKKHFFSHLDILPSDSTERKILKEYFNNPVNTEDKEQNKVTEKLPEDTRLIKQPPPIDKKGEPSFLKQIYIELEQIGKAFVKFTTDDIDIAEDLQGEDIKKVIETKVVRSNGSEFKLGDLFDDFVTNEISQLSTDTLYKVEAEIEFKKAGENLLNLISEPVAKNTHNTDSEIVTRETPIKNQAQPGNPTIVDLVENNTEKLKQSIIEIQNELTQSLIKSREENKSIFEKMEKIREEERYHQKKLDNIHKKGNKI